MPPDTPYETPTTLKDLEALTDVDLSGLGVDEFLGELLNRVRDILRADTAAVLLLDARSQQLIATAACGIEEEVRHGVRVPMGTGFAGRIAMLKQPIMLDRVDATTVANPILWEKGIQVMLGVPLLVGDEVLGVLHVGRLQHDPFNEDDVQLLRVVAERVAGATHARRWAIERVAAALLERSLLPGRLPECPGLEFAARYLTPLEQTVGGDWYDLFVLPSKDLWVVTGDVAGHGLAAAVVMGRVRSALRSYALLGEEPDRVLDLTDLKVSHFEVGTMVTAVCAVSSPPYDTFRVATAGHPRPVIARPGERSVLADVPIGLPLGIGSGPKRRAVDIPLAPGSLMLLHTDGLIERRGESISAGQRRLTDAVTAEDPEYVCRSVLRKLIGYESPADDVAVVAVRRTPSD